MSNVDKTTGRPLPTDEAEIAEMLLNGTINAETFHFTTEGGTELNVQSIVGRILAAADSEYDGKRAKESIDVMLFEMVRRAHVKAEELDFEPLACFDMLVQIAEKTAEREWALRHNNQEAPPKWRKPASWKTIVSRYRTAIANDIRPGMVHTGHYKAPKKNERTSPDGQTKVWDGTWTLPATEPVEFSSVGSFNKIWRIHPSNPKRKDYVEELRQLNDAKAGSRDDIKDDGDGALPEWVQELTPAQSTVIQALASRMNELTRNGDAELLGKMLESCRGVLKRHKAEKKAA